MLSAWLASPARRRHPLLRLQRGRPGVREERCVAAGKKPILELAGNDIVSWSGRTPTSSYAAEALTESFYGSGQLCMIPNQVVVHPEVADELIAELAEKVTQLRPGYPEDDGVLLTPVLRNEKFYELPCRCLREGRRGDLRRLGPATGRHQVDAGMFLEPTVLRVAGMRRARDMLAVRTETFFPLLPVVVADDAANPSCWNLRDLHGVQRVRPAELGVGARTRR